MSGEEYIFHKVATDNVYTRKCFGTELLTSNMTEFMDGSTQLTITVAISISSSPSRKLLEAHVRAAWLAFRHFIPGMACKVSRSPSKDNGFAFRYTVPLSAEDSEKWLDETVLFSDEIKPLYEKHCDLKDKRWWRSSEDRYVAELHISPLGKCWQISMVISHNSADGRSAFAMMDIYLGFLTDVLEQIAAPVSVIKWGTEVVRLAPPGPFTMSLAERGVPPDVTLDVTPSKEMKDVSMDPPAVTPWLYAPLETGRHGDVSHLAEFSREITARLHAVARRRGRTITQVVTALSALAHAETSLKTAEAVGKERFKEVASAFSTSTHYLIALNFMNHRHKLPGGYDSYESPTSTPLNSSDGTPFLLAMDVVRKLIKLDGANSVRRELDETAFWDMVQEVANAWQTVDQSLEGYFTRELAGHVAYQNFNPEIFYVPAIFVSSIGDLGRLGLLNSYLPQPREQALAVHDVVCGIRARAPVLIIMLYEYNGQLSCHFLTGGEFTTKEALELVTENFKEWTAAITG